MLLSYPCMEPKNLPRCSLPMVIETDFLQIVFLIDVPYHYKKGHILPDRLKNHYPQCKDHTRKKHCRTDYLQSSICLDQRIIDYETQTNYRSVRFPHAKLRKHLCLQRDVGEIQKARKIRLALLAPFQHFSEKRVGAPSLGAVLLII